MEDTLDPWHHQPCQNRRHFDGRYEGNCIIAASTTSTFDPCTLLDALFYLPFHPFLTAKTPYKSGPIHKPHTLCQAGSQPVLVLEHALLNLSSSYSVFFKYSTPIDNILMICAGESAVGKVLLNTRIFRMLETDGVTELSCP